MDTDRAAPVRGWRPALAATLPPVLVAALALAACAPDHAAAPPPAARPSAVPAPEPRPDDLTRMRRERAQAARDAAAGRAPGPASVTMAQYMSNVQDTLLARGLLRPSADGIAPAPAERLAEDFIRIALYDEYVSRNGRLVPETRPAPLRRWERPVRVMVEFGASVPPATRIRDRNDIADYVQRLSRISGHPIAMTAESGNFVVLLLAEDERRTIGPRLAQLIPGIPASDIRAIQGLAPQNYCTVFAYSPGQGQPYSNAVAVIRAELPDRLRLSCIHEELAQGLGLANDSPEVRPSIFNDDEEFAFLTPHDELLLKILYDKRLRPGMTEAEARPIVARIAAELAP